MNTRCLVFASLLVSCYSTKTANRRYSPDWTDLDTRPIPDWYDKNKIGIFLHWGVFSVPSFGSEWFWDNWRGNVTKYVNFMKSNYPPNFSYHEFAPMFKAEFFDPDKWARLFREAGARYVVLTSKHHEGFTLFPSKRSFAWNSVDLGPRRDLVGDLSRAVRQEGLKFGVYHSLYEWNNPIYLVDKATNFTSRQYTDNKLWPDLKQLIDDYEPSVLWSDGDWEAKPEYWRSKDFLAWLYSDSPVKDEVVVNDRWGIGTYCKHGDFYNCADRYNPGELQNHKWENAFTLDSKSWGFRRDTAVEEVLTIEDVLKQVVSTVSCGGNVLINVGPTKEGVIDPIYQERLQSLGKWLDINGKAIYSTSPWFHQNDSLNGDVWYTCVNRNYDPKKPTLTPQKDSDVETLYAIVLKWPEDGILEVADLHEILKSELWSVTMLGNAERKLKWQLKSKTVLIELPNKANVKSEHAWTLMLTNDKQYSIESV